MHWKGTCYEVSHISLFLGSILDLNLLLRLLSIIRLLRPTMGISFLTFQAKANGLEENEDSPHTSDFEVGVISHLQFLPHLREEDLNLLRAPRLRVTKLSEQKPKPNH